MKISGALIGLAALLATAGCGDRTAAPANTADALPETGVNAAEIDAALADANALDAQEDTAANTGGGDTR